MSKESIILSSLPIEVGEFPNHKEVTFLISVLDEYNLNGVLIEKAEGEKYHNTIVGYPILAYLKYDKDGKPEDFGGHELRAKFNSETKEVEYYFATHPIGSVLESWIEKREVDGYEGEKDCILIKTKLWKSRLPEYFKVFDKLWDKGEISSSWEISVSKSEKTNKGKVLKEFEFIGNCILGTTVTGAVKGAGVLEVASADKLNFELSNALLSDILNSDSDDIINNNYIGESHIESSNNEGSNEELSKNKKVVEDTKDVSALTENDLHRKVRKAINSLNEEKYFYLSIIYPYEFTAIAHTWDRESEEDFVKFKYTVNSDDTISITSQTNVKMKFVETETLDNQLSELEEKIKTYESDIAEAGKSITTLTKEKEDLETQISELNKYKEQVEEMEKAENERILSEKKEELKSLALEDELIESSELEEDETLKQIFSELTLENFEASQEKIEVIKGRRAIEKFKQSKQVEESELETSESKEGKANPKRNLNDSDEMLVSATDAMKAFLSKK